MLKVPYHILAYSLQRSSHCIKGPPITSEALPSHKSPSFMSGAPLTSEVPHHTRVPLYVRGPHHTHWSPHHIGVLPSCQRPPLHQSPAIMSETPITSESPHHARGPHQVRVPSYIWGLPAPWQLMTLIHGKLGPLLIALWRGPKQHPKVLLHYA